MTDKAAVRHAVRLGAGEALEKVRGVAADRLAPYKLDPFAFIRRLQVWDPTANTFVPFEPWPHQIELLSEWMDLEHLKATGVLRFRNTLGEKSRQMGDTVALAGGCLWVVTHHDAPLLMQHQDLQEVADSGPTWDSFFGKIKTMWERQPWEIGKAPLHFVGGNSPIIRNTAHPIRFITGEGQTADPGRGGRYSGVFIDEAARIRYDSQGQAALARACPEGRLLLSTPYGRGNVYYRIRQERPAGWRFVDHHWSRHPIYSRGLHVAALPPTRDHAGGYAVQPADQRAVSLSCPQCAATVRGETWTAANPVAHRFPGRLTSPWYEQAVLEMTREQVAEELDIDYTAALTARVFEEFDERTHVLETIAYDPRTPLEFSFDYGWDVTHVGIWQDRPDVLCKIGEVEATETLPEDVGDDVRAVLERLGVHPRDLQKHNTRSWLAVGDPAGEGTQLGTGEPLTADYWRAGFVIGNPGPQRVATTIKALKRLLDGRPKPVRYSREGCPLTILHMQQNRWPTDAAGQRRAGAVKPVDDEHNHACFVAGTIVETINGGVPIEDVREGDLVLTRCGYRPVTMAESRVAPVIVRVEFGDGVLVGTPDHPVWTDDGWTPLERADAIYVLREAENRGGVVAHQTECVVTGVTEQAANLAGRVGVIDVEHLRGRRSEARRVLATASVRLASTDETESVLALDHLQVVGERDAVLPPEPRVAVLASPIPGVRRHQLRAALMRAAQAARTPPPRLRVPRSPDRRVAVLARRPAAGMVPVVPAVSRVGFRLERHLVSIHRSVDSAVVYNLEVEDAHEFFANGVLVHNCRADAYYVTYKFPPPNDDFDQRHADEQERTAIWGGDPAPLGEASVPGFGDKL